MTPAAVVSHAAMEELVSLDFVEVHAVVVAHGAESAAAASSEHAAYVVAGSADGGSAADAYLVAAAAAEGHRVEVADVADARCDADSCAPAGFHRSSLDRRPRRSALTVLVHNPTRGHNSEDRPQGSD